jgi:hypothetical protein
MMNNDEGMQLVLVMAFVWCCLAAGTLLLVLAAKRIIRFYFEEKLRYLDKCTAREPLADNRAIASVR